ncbi:hypothetical protein [Oceanibium sediminis]|uniref:hypothetical protein n=1 Tax=Oceanibium sediminis TaxID=2026339 RepID=UPI000DD31A8A|nr:hypothetical protein [Oceanibium sediminis]
MKQAAVLLGVIGGVLGLIMGISVAGWIAFTGWIDGEVTGQLPVALDTPTNAQMLRIVGVVGPLLAIAGGAMAVLRPFTGSILLFVAAAGMFAAFGAGFFALFPVAMCGMAGFFALLGAATREPGGLT